MGRRKVKAKKSTKFRDLFILLVIVAAIAYLFKSFLGEESAFKIKSGSSTFGSPIKKTDRKTDEAGHTEGFWTSDRFKW